MKMISGFTFGHNLIDSGYPIVEAIRAVQPYVDEVVIVDCASTDGTRELLEKLRNVSPLQVNKYGDYGEIIILDGQWGNQAGDTLRRAHNNYVRCSGDVIVHFEADEVYDDDLIRAVVSNVRAGKIEDSHYSVMRLQLEGNMQRCRWYPELVHRVFPRMSNTRKEGHTTNNHNLAFALTEQNGYLWDITNSFRDNWFNRVEQQAKLRNTEPQYLVTPIHSLHKAELTKEEAKRWICGEDYWTYTNTPFSIPEILKPLLGVTKYAPKIRG